MCGGGNQTFTITFTATKANPFPPVINDGTKTSDPGNDSDFVTLVTTDSNVIIRAGGDISSIDNVTIEPGVDLFSQNPTKQSDGTWKGVVGSSTPNGDTGYNVQYTLNGISYSQDPKLRIKQ
ncbi:MAG: hypothetical protein IPF52_01180 [Saprospiraceae bacterium]|nr:hypothetical protein [Saprospiraceae bacterium]